MISLVLVLILTITAITMLPSRTNAESPWATVKVECVDPYFGSIKGDEIQEVWGEGTMEFPVQGEIIHVIMTKANDNRNEMTVSILVDGNQRMSKSTNDPEGEIRMSYSLGGEDDDGGGAGCLSALSISTICVFLSVR